MGHEHIDINLNEVAWVKSNHSGGTGGDCVEVAMGLPGVVAMRDSKNPDGPRLVFALADWRAFLAHVADAR